MDSPLHLQCKLLRGLYREDILKIVQKIKFFFRLFFMYIICLLINTIELVINFLANKSQQAGYEALGTM